MNAAKLQPAILGGLFIGVLSALPFVNMANCCCLWLVVGGALAAYVMQQNHPYPVTLGDGALVGLGAGVIGFVVMLIVSIPIGLLTGPDLQRMQMGGFGQEGMSPEVAEMMRHISPAVIAFIGGAVFLVIGSAASTVGGIIGAVIFRQGSPPLPPSDAPPASWAPLPSGWAPPADAPPPPPLPGADETRIAPASLESETPGASAPDATGDPWTKKPGSGDPS
jgi:hypothetical protein